MSKELTAAEIILLRRRELDWSQARLAAEANYSRKMISGLETGVPTSKVVVEAVAVALGLTPELLLSRTGHGGKCSIDPMTEIRGKL